MKAQQIPKAVRDLVHERSGNVCEICDSARAAEIHHRLGRQMGGSRELWINLPGNLLDVCRECHQLVTSPRGLTEKFRGLGWIVKRGVNPPSEFPCLLWHEGIQAWWLLGDDGGLAEVTDLAERSQLLAFDVEVS